MYIFIPYLHFIGIMLLTGAMMAEYMMLKPGLSGNQFRLLSITNWIYFVSVVLVLATGLLRWFAVDPKGPEFFSTNPLFHIKVTLFAIIIILSFFPSAKISKWHRLYKADNTFEVSEKEMKKAEWFLRIEFLLLLVIPLLAVMVAKGH